MTARENRSKEAWMRKRYWPLTCGEPPRLPDGSVDVRALCRQWDDAFNAGLNGEELEVVGV